MSTLLDWSRFKTDSVGIEKAFEAFTAQLFERWLRREYGQDLTSYVLYGAGGDGGVEAFARLPSGNVVGLQTKWFEGNIYASEIGKIRSSLDRAAKTFPTLKRYVVALRQNLTKARNEEEKGGVERWEEFIPKANADYPGVDIIRWDEAGLLEQLACPGNHELKALWFQGELTFKTIEVAWEKARLRLATRYIPDLHTVGRMDHMIDEDLWSLSWVTHARGELARCLAAFTQATSDLEGFARLTHGRRPPDLDGALSESRTALVAFQRHADLLVEVLACGPRLELQNFPSNNALSELADLVKGFKKSPEGTHTVEHVERALRAMQPARNSLILLDDTLRSSSRPRVFSGPAGCGKTHAAANAIGGLVGRILPAVILLAKGIDPALGAGSILGAVLDIPGWPLGRILDGLEALATLCQASVDRSASQLGGFARCLLIIDGLEESGNSPSWAGVLGDLAVELRSRPRVHLVVTARPEFLRQIVIPANQDISYLGDDGATDLPAMLAAYADHYGISIEQVPWLGWALRTPLEVRLLAEEFRGRAITAQEGANSNLLTLFRRKLARLEAEARERARGSAWSEHLGLLAAILMVLSSPSEDGGSLQVKDLDIVKQAAAIDPEFTAQRTRGALSFLGEHGLVDRWVPPAHGLRGPQPEYRLSTRHLSDFVLGTSLADTVIVAIQQGATVPFPSALHWRTSASVFFAAHLAEQGHFVIDIAWKESPQNLERLHAQSLALLPPGLSGSRRDEIAGWLIKTTALNRIVLRGLMVPVSRIPDHPLGPRLLDEALRQLPLAERDQVWSVPEDLDGAGPWRSCFDHILDEFGLSPEVDRWNGRPLLAAWTCSSVVERRRQRAREMLAVWGANRLADMVQLLSHMADVDDPQIVDDVAVSALGAAIGAPVNDPSLKDLALLVDRLFFADDATAWTESVPVRVAARGIVERAALVFPGEFTDELERARPPYAPRGAWPAIDPQEAGEHGHFGGELVNSDLSWYVADGCFDRFAKPASEHRGPADHSQLDYRLEKAMQDGLIEGPLANIDGHQIEGENEELSQVEGQPPDFFDSLRRLILERVGNQDAGVLSDSELISLAMEQVGIESNHAVPTEPAYSEEFRELLRHATVVTGIAKPTPSGVRNGMIAHLVRSWGWSEEGFARRTWDKPPEVVDDVIAHLHRPATHGSRSEVCRFREKYVWAAVDRIAGALADRLPVWSDEDGKWVRLSNLDGLGNEVPDPLPRSAEGDGRAMASDSAWAPDGMLPEQVNGEDELGQRAERWLTEGVLPDPRIFVHGAIEGWVDAAVLAFSHSRRGHQCCIDQLVQVRAFGVNATDLPLLRRDAPHVIGELYQEGVAWLDEGVYASPALACWAPWLTWQGLDQGYDSFDPSGGVRRVELLATVGSITARFEGEWPQEPKVWMPSPPLRNALGIVGMLGGRWLRSYTNRGGEPVAIEKDVPTPSFSFDHHYLVTDLSRFVDVLASEKQVPLWVVRVLLEATPALFLRGDTFDPQPGLKNRSRDVVCVVVRDPRTGEFEVIPVSDQFKLLDSWYATPEAAAESLENAVRTNAYFRWQAAGEPPGDELRFWLEAERGNTRRGANAI